MRDVGCFLAILAVIGVFVGGYWLLLQLLILYDKLARALRPRPDPIEERWTYRYVPKPPEPPIVEYCLPVPPYDPAKAARELAQRIRGER